MNAGHWLLETIVLAAGKKDFNASLRTYRNSGFRSLVMAVECLKIFEYVGLLPATS